MTGSVVDVTMACEATATARFARALSNRPRSLAEIRLPESFGSSQRPPLKHAAAKGGGISGGLVSPLTCSGEALASMSYN